MFYNRAVPLPMGLADIAVRLSSGYYRQPAALEHDIALLEHNAAMFNDPASDVVRNAGGEYAITQSCVFQLCTCRWRRGRTVCGSVLRGCRSAHF